MNRDLGKNIKLFYTVDKLEGDDVQETYKNRFENLRNTDAEDHVAGSC